MDCTLTKGYYHFPRVSSEYPDCSLPCTGDIYGACSYNGQYCFSFHQKNNNPSYKKGILLKPISIKYMINVLDGKHPKNPYYKRFFKDKFPLHIGGLADSFDDFERKYGVGYKLLEKMEKFGLIKQQASK